MTYAIRTLCVLVAAVLLSGCLGNFGGNKRGSFAVYEPTVALRPAADWPAVDWQLAVAKPTTNRALDSARIAVKPEPGIVQSYKGAAWADSAPELLQALIVHAFEDSGRIVAVGRLSSGLRADYMLMLDLRAFEAVYNGATVPDAVIELNAKLVHAPSNRVLASRTFRATETAAATDVPTVVVAFERGLEQVLGELVGWTLTTGQANREVLHDRR